MKNGNTANPVFSNIIYNLQRLRRLLSSEVTYKVLFIIFFLLTVVYIYHLIYLLRFNLSINIFCISMLHKNEIIKDVLDSYFYYKHLSSSVHCNHSLNTYKIMITKYYLTLLHNAHLFWLNIGRKIVPVLKCWRFPLQAS